MRRTLKSEIQDTKEWDQLFSQKKFKDKGYSWRNKDYKYLSKFLKLSVFEGTLLDVGCAFGDGLIYFKNKSPKITEFSGCDLSSHVINICKQNNKLEKFNFFTCDITKPLNKKYDIIICLQTIEHVLDPISAIDNLIKATNKMLIISVPYKNRRSGKSHLWYFDENDFQDLFDFYVLDQKNKHEEYRNIFWIKEMRNDD